MKGLYDIHCHILPEVDDGSRSMEESCWMLRKEYEEGVRHVILTPHFRYEMFETPLEIIKKQFRRLRREAEHIGEEGMHLYLGCELHSSIDMVSCLKKRERLTLAGSRFVLVEFEGGDSENYIRGRIRELTLNGYIPIVAHVERYHATRSSVDFIAELREMGAYIQINNDTISGVDGFMAKRFARKVMESGLLDFAGTDGHRKDTRVPDIKNAAAQMEKIMGADYVRRIYMENPRKITG